jgi:lactoylglutathione lyase
MAAMPRIEHVALWARDLDLVCDFYVRHFGAKPGPRYQNRAKGFTSRFLCLGDGARLELMTSMGRLSSPGGEHLGLAHIAISLGSEAAVDALTAQLKASGVSVLDGPRRTGDGYYESVVQDPEGNRIELTV